MPQHNQGAVKDTKLMDMGVRTMTVDITEGHTNLMLMIEPVTKKGNDVPMIRQQASINAITTVVEAVDTEDTIKMNNLFETRC